jgi:hypothetical protein
MESSKQVQVLPSKQTDSSSTVRVTFRLQNLKTLKKQFLHRGWRYATTALLADDSKGLLVGRAAGLVVLVPDQAGGAGHNEGLASVVALDERGGVGVSEVVVVTGQLLRSAGVGELLGTNERGFVNYFVHSIQTEMNDLDCSCSILLQNKTK